MLKNYLVLCGCLLWSVSVWGKTLPVPDDARIKSAYPEIYQVKTQDSLWDVLSQFVEEPWDARDLWTQQTVKLYPGDQISLIRQGARRLLQVKHNRVVKLSPGIHSPREKRAIDVVPISSIQQFLNRPYLVTEEELANAPYIVASGDGRLLMTPHTMIYARGIPDDTDQLRYLIIKQGKTFQDPISEEVLAHEGIFLGEAELKRTGSGEDELSTLLITHSEQEISPGDRLLPMPAYEPRLDLIPGVPDEVRNGRVLAVLNGLNQIGQYQVVVINKGLTDGLEEGHVLATYRGGDVIRDRVTREELTLPNLKSGVLLVFKTFDRVSYALVMEATSAIYVLDEVNLP